MFPFFIKLFNQIFVLVFCLPMNHIDKFQNLNEMDRPLMEEIRYKQYVEELQLEFDVFHDK